MINSFDDLSNELLLDIFDYVDPRNLFHTFLNLNSRINNLLASLKCLPLIVNNEENEEVIAFLAPHIGLLQVNIWSDIDLRGFCNLYSLTLIRPTQIQLKQIRSDTMPMLAYLSPSPNVYFSSPNQFIYDALSGRFSRLRWARLGHIDSFDPNFCSQSSSLRYLHIGCHETTIISFILASCPNLDHLHVDLLRDGDKTTLTPRVINNHPLRQLILRDYCYLVSYKDIHTLISYIPHARTIEFKFDCKIPFISLIQYLSDHLRHLRKFDCDIAECPLDPSTSLTTIQQVHPCFCHITCRTQGANFRIFATQ
jgi:hypothetical protein